MYKYILLGATFCTLPYAAFAAEKPTDFKSLVGLFLNLIDQGIYLFFALTVLVIIWGVVRTWVIQGGDAKTIEAGKKLVFVGIITLVIMTSLWGILHILQSTLSGSGDLEADSVAIQ